MALVLTADERLAVRNRVLAELTGKRPISLRPKQIIGNSPRVLLLAGRRSGKTLASMEHMADRILADQGTYVLVGPSFGHARDVMVEQPGAGLLAALARRGVNVSRTGVGEWRWSRSIGELRHGDRLAAKIDGADDGAPRIQGHSVAAAAVDELRLVADRPARMALFESIEPALSGSAHPQIVISTTPRPTALLRELARNPAWDLRHMTIWENAENLPAEYLAQMGELSGTRMGRQELEGELLEDIEGALWRERWFDRVEKVPLGAAPHGDGVLSLRQMKLGLDPAGGQGTSRQAMVAAGLGWDGRIYVVHADARREAEGAWLARCVRTAQELQAEMVLEANYGDRYLIGALETVMGDIGVRVPYRAIKVSKGKAERALPVALLYETGKVTHVGDLSELEAEQESFTGAPGDPSDMVDALVHACNDLMGYQSSPADHLDYGAVQYGSYAGVEGAAVPWS